MLSSRGIIRITALAAALFTVSLSAAPESPYEAMRRKAELEKNWKLVFADEFNGNGRLDPKRWNYEEGFVRNNEQQYYTRDDVRNATQRGGKLIITARKDNRPNPSFDPKAPENAFFGKRRERITTTSASVITLDRFSFLYGRVEVRAKLPRGQGVWPAIWMLGENRTKVGWPKCGEIDIMEFVWKERDTVHGTLHWYQPNGSRQHNSKGAKTTSTNLHSDFHLYAIEWDKDKIDFFFDNKKYFTFDVNLANQADGSNPFRRPQYLLLNLAIGGSWGGTVAGDTLPATYEIDYVRIYQKR